MSLLEVITKASANPEHIASQSEYPIILNPDDIFLCLRPQHETIDTTSLANPVTGWQISQTDSQLIYSGRKFYTKLKRKLKDTSNFNKANLIGTLSAFLENIRKTVGISIGVDPSDSGYTLVLIEKVGPLMGRDVAALVLEACIALEIWDFVESLIVNGIIGHSCYSNLVMSLVAKKRSNLLCLSIKHAPNLGFSELLCILKYFLRPSKEACNSMMHVRKEWERQTMIAIEKASDKYISDKKSQVAKDASILLMLAHDEFSTYELCLHYLLASPNVDKVILASSIAKLNGKEMMRLIKYLGKWLKKYERFPQAGPCPKASSLFGWKACDWVPKLEDVVQWLGVLLDENFSSLVLHPEFHEELKSIEELVASLALEAKLSSCVGIVIGNLRAESEREQNQ